MQHINKNKIFLNTSNKIQFNITEKECDYVCYTITTFDEINPFPNSRPRDKLEIYKKTKRKIKKVYVGSTNDFGKRIYSHNYLKCGAKKTRGRYWVPMLILSGFLNKSHCYRFEKQLQLLLFKPKVWKKYVLSKYKIGKINIYEKTIIAIKILLKYGFRKKEYVHLRCYIYVLDKLQKTLGNKIKYLWNDLEI